MKKLLIMDSDGDDLENLFEEYENDNRAENTENKTVNETPGATKIAAPKRIVKNPRLKFNAERLCGERGIPVLVDHFKNVKFKGPGHEKEDLDKLLTNLEHWTHRLFPSMKFEDCLTHIERLGKKRQVQTCLRKIRLDMPILNNDFVKDNEDDDNVKRNNDSDREEISAFDRLLGEREEMPSTDIYVPESIPSSSSFGSMPISKDTSGHVFGSSFGLNLSEEQKERMEHNRKLAAEKRKARFAAMKQNIESSQIDNHETIFTENVSRKQNLFNELVGSSECNDGNAENNKLELEINHDFREISNSSPDLNKDNSEKLGLDDLMNLVDEYPVPGESAATLPSKQIKSVSSNININNNLSLNDVENFKNFDSISGNIENNTPSTSKYLEKYSDKNLNLESSLALICETSVEPKVVIDPEDNVSIIDKEVIMKNKDLSSMDCEDENSDNNGVNINKTNKFLTDEAQNVKNIDSVSKIHPQDSFSMKSSSTLDCGISED